MIAIGQNVWDRWSSHDTDSIVELQDRNYYGYQIYPMFTSKRFVF